MESETAHVLLITGEQPPGARRRRGNEPPESHSSIARGSGSAAGRDTVEVGFYGKLPSHGDFLRRRVPDAFVERWDAWLQQSMSESRSTLGERWLEVYLTSPVWRFVFAAGACGPVPVLGLMAPSVDRVGRHFPLTIIAELPPDVDCAAAATQSSAFFESAERLVVETLAAEEVDFERFDERIIALGGDLAALDAPREVVLDGAAGAIVNGASPNCWQVPIDVSGNLAPLFGQLLSFRLLSVYEPLAIWWTEGSSIVEPSCLFVPGLPPPGTFGAFLDGSWGPHGWSSALARIDRRSTAPNEAWIEPVTSLRFRSAATTDVGRVRQVNQDSFVARPEVGIWAVADGLGDIEAARLRAGKYATRLRIWRRWGALTRRSKTPETASEA